MTIEIQGKDWIFTVDPLGLAGFVVSVAAPSSEISDGTCDFFVLSNFISCSFKNKPC